MRRTIAALLLLSLWLCAAGSTSVNAGDPLAVIVHPSRSAELTRAEVERIYLKKKRHWDDGTPIVAINRGADSKTRAEFNHRIFGEAEKRLARYWDEQYFQGILPPITLSSDEAVRRYVATDRNAVGYVRATAVDATVHVALTLE